MSFKIKGAVTEQESKKGIPGLFIKAYDKDLLFDDLLGSATTDDNGEFYIDYEGDDFQELFDKKPDIYLEIKTASGQHIHSTEQHVRFGSGDEEYFSVEISGELLPEPLPPSITFPDPTLTAVDLRSLMIVLNRASGRGQMDQVLQILNNFNKSNPETMLFMPGLMIKSLVSKFAFYAMCGGTTATSVVTLGATATVLTTPRTVGFTYSYTGAPTCTLKVQSVTVLVVAKTMPVTQLTDSGSAFTGFIPRTAGVLPGGTVVTITATFSASAGWCDTCNLPTAAVTTTATIV